MSTALAAKPTRTSKTGETLSTNKLSSHPLSEFVPGEMGKEEFDALSASIKAHGLRHPISIYEGKILDGRQRYAACTKAGVKVATEEFKGTAAEAAQFVVDNNLHRRQLDSMQKAMCGARMHLDSFNATKSTDKKPLYDITQAEAAVLVGIGSGTINLAVRVINSKNTMLIKRIERGQATRAEIDEVMFDRAAAQEKKNALSAGSGAPGSDLDDDDLFGDDEDGVTPRQPRNAAVGGNVVDLDEHRSAVAGKRTVEGHRAVETPASKAVQYFKGMDEAQRKNFVVMAWPWLAPAIKAAGKALDEKALAKPEAAKPTAPAKGAKAAKPKLVATRKPVKTKVKKAASA